jgi:hypothetical protein
MGLWSPGEDLLLLRAVAGHGQKWSVIQRLGLVPGRTARQMHQRFREVLNPHLDKQPLSAEVSAPGGGRDSECEVQGGSGLILHGMFLTTCC